MFLLFSNEPRNGIAISKKLLTLGNNIPLLKTAAVLADYNPGVFSPHLLNTYNMKHLLTASLGSLLLATVCATAQDVSRASAGTTSSQAPAGPTMKGAYSMLMQIVNDGTRDSMLSTQQFKIYTDRHFMYARPIVGDTLAYFGIGTYQMAGGQLMEYPFYTSAGGAQADTFSIDITKMGNGYVQVIRFPADSQGRKYVLTEEYTEVSKPRTSPLDGAWKQTKTMFTPKGGKPVAGNNPTQYKVYQSGHFMWGSTVQDSATGKPVSYFGYGTFEMMGPNKAREIPTNSTFRASLVGTPTMLQLEFMGKDAYRQTILWPDGKSVEEYQRLK
jgi:hypothetical protein